MLKSTPSYSYRQVFEHLAVNQAEYITIIFLYLKGVLNEQ